MVTPTDSRPAAEAAASMAEDSRGQGMRWHWQDLDYASIDVEQVRASDELFLLLCSASFMESGSGTYTRNLIEYFADDPPVAAWLNDHWEPEELQHGRALKAYVQHVWPEFDWEAAYADFFSEYGKLCTVEELEPTRGQEMAARCVVEMGTTTYYQALNAVCSEPVLRDLTWRIRTDEVQHYKHFYHYFLQYRQRDGLKRWQVAAALWRRVAELRQSDADVALRHAVSWRFGDARQDYAAMSKRVFAMMAHEYPIELAVRMVMKPLQLSNRLQRWAERPVAALTRRLLLQ